MTHEQKPCQWRMALEPKPIPSGWRLHARDGLGNPKWLHRKKGLLVLCSVMRQRDGKQWLHVSATQHRRQPTWDELVMIKELFMGTDSKAIKVIPPRDEYVNIDPRVLHLWVCLDGDPLPDFRSAAGTV